MSEVTFRAADFGGDFITVHGHPVYVGDKGTEAASSRVSSDGAVSISRSRIDPPHEVRDVSKLSALVEAMKEHGWQGRPVLLEKVVETVPVSQEKYHEAVEKWDRAKEKLIDNLSDSQYEAYTDDPKGFLEKRLPAKPKPPAETKTVEKYQAWTGSHRLAAAKKAGLKNIPAVVIDASKLSRIADKSAHGTFMHAFSDDDDKLSALQEAGDSRAADLMREEMMANRKARDAGVLFDSEVSPEEMFAGHIMQVDLNSIAWFNADDRVSFEGDFITIHGHPVYVGDKKGSEKPGGRKPQTEEEAAGRIERVMGKLPKIVDALPTLRQQIEKDIHGSDAQKSRVAAAVARIMDATTMRVGSERFATKSQKGEKGQDSFGASSLLKEHVSVDGDTVTFKFPGKSRKNWERSVKDPALAEAVKHLQSLPGAKLMQYHDERTGAIKPFTEVHAREYLKPHGIDPKNFRTYHATRLASEMLADKPAPKNATEAKKTIDGVVKAVSQHLGNTPATARKHYINPAVLEHYAKPAEVQASFGEDPDHDDSDRDKAFLALLKAIEKRVKAGELKGEDPFPEDVEDVEDDEDGLTEQEKPEKRVVSDRSEMSMKWTAAKRRELKKEHPEDFGDSENELFPVSDQDDLDSAARLLGKAEDPKGVKTRLIAIAKRKGLKLPKSWEEAAHSAETAPEMVVYPDRFLFEEGEYADKDFAITAEEMYPAAGDAPISLDLEHVPTLLDGKLGTVRNRRLVNEDGRMVLRGDVHLPAWLADNLPEGQSNLSCTWQKSDKTLSKVALVRHPRLDDAVLMSAYTAFAKRHDTPEGQTVLQSIHDMASRNGARCDSGNVAEMHAGHEVAAMQKIHDLATENGADCRSGKRNTYYSREDGGRENKMSIAQKFVAFLKGEGVTIPEALLEDEVTPTVTPAAKPDAAFASANTEAQKQIDALQAKLDAQTAAAEKAEFDAKAKADADAQAKIAAMEAQLATMAAEKRESEIKRDAEVFASELLRSAKATKAEVPVIIAAFARAAQDDDSAPVDVKFTAAGEEKTGSRLDAFKALYSERPAHTLFGAQLPVGDSAAAIYPTAETPDPTADKPLDLAKEKDRAEYQRLINMTPAGQAAFKANGKAN